MDRVLAQLSLADGLVSAPETVFDAVARLHAALRACGIKDRPMRRANKQHPELPPRPGRDRHQPAPQRGSAASETRARVS